MEHTHQRRRTNLAGMGALALTMVVYFFALLLLSFLLYHGRVCGKRCRPTDTSVILSHRGYPSGVALTSEHVFPLPCYAGGGTRLVAFFRSSTNGPRWEPGIYRCMWRDIGKDSQKPSEDVLIRAVHCVITVIWTTPSHEAIQNPVRIPSP
jgi:hypothetical protein